MMVHHIGIAVHDLDAALQIWGAGLDLETITIEEVPSQDVRVAFLKGGPVKIELLEPLKPDSAVGKFLENRGEGVHHIAFQVEDIEKDLNDLKEKGYRLINETPIDREGGLKIAFCHPKAFNGVLVELYQE